MTRVVQALEMLARGPLSAPQLADALQIHPRTARRMLWRLADENYVTQLNEPRRRYALTLRVVALAAQSLERSDLTRIACVLRATREEQERSPEALAHDAGLPVRTLVRIERCEANPTWTAMLQIAGALGLSLHELAERLDERSP